ncbi:hypothetical protein [Butyrivibrio sp. VCD2006]|uniref:hypothetical protein n=1 Tax=Butyrivibrio sp. VCD2006 TaxID=1280664 RepID=UPI00041128FC|nr:hypothetical protein [Butyrivibrio sp. VCD2006]
MRQEAAFNFIPELIGDFVHTMELSENPKLLYLEAAIRTLHMAADVYESVEEHNNTKKKDEKKRALQKEYSELEKNRTEHYVQEAARKIDITYERVKIKIHDGDFRDKEVRKFISCLSEELHKARDIFNDIQIDPDYPYRDEVEEVIRKTLRDYNKLLTVFIEEEDNNG